MGDELRDAGLVRSGISIADPSCVAKSYPDFWSDFASLSI
jgi:5-enolpyruvylshikimate-3-phosphate synthase